MADDVAIPDFSGLSKSIKTDEVAGKHYQVNKLDGGGDGVSVPLIAGRQLDAASLPVALSTEAIAILNALATQTTAAAILAKLSADPSTATLQTSGNTLTGAVNETAPASDTASSGLNGRLQRLAQRVTSLIGLLPTALGSAAAAGSLAVTQSTEDVARVGIVTETAPASDTASSGLNGRLQRIAQRITSLLGVFDPPTTGTKSNVSGAATSGTILASNSSRKGATIYNDSSAILYLDLSGGAASSSSFSVAMAANSFYELPEGKRGVYTGAITGIWASATGAARVTEFT